MWPQEILKAGNQSADILLAIKLQFLPQLRLPCFERSWGWPVICSILLFPWPSVSRRVSVGAVYCLQPPPLCLKVTRSRGPGSSSEYQGQGAGAKARAGLADTAIKSSTSSGAANILQHETSPHEEATQVSRARPGDVRGGHYHSMESHLLTISLQCYTEYQ